MKDVDREGLGRFLERLVLCREWKVATLRQLQVGSIIGTALIEPGNLALFGGSTFFRRSATARALTTSSLQTAGTNTVAPPITA